MNVDRLPVNPRILLWARERAGYSLEQAAVIAKIKTSRSGQSPRDRLSAWEKGEDAPTVTQLKELVHAYRLPIITFFLPDPPLETSRLKDFRTVGDHPVQQSSPEFLALKLKIESLHDTLQEIAAADPQPPVEFVGSLSLNTPALQAVKVVRSLIPWKIPVPKHIRTSKAAFGILRERIQNQGVFVMLRGDLGSHHSRIDPEEFRGIAMADKKVPLIVINPNDADTAKIFTLIHEFVHVLLGNNAISNIESQPSSSVAKEERFCNKVTVEFLVPEEHLARIIPEEIGVLEGDELVEALAFLADRYKVSRLVIARRLLEMRRISKDAFWDIYNTLNAQHRRLPAKKSRKSGGPNPNVVDGYRLGMKLMRRILEAADDGIISYSVASRVLNLSPGRFDKVMA